MRILDSLKIEYDSYFYECDEFIDGIHIADMLSQSYDISFKTLVAAGKSSEYFVFVLPIHRELDLKKAAKSVGEKSVSLLHVKDIKNVTGYIRGGCSPIGMKKLFPTYIHESCMNFPFIFVSAGIRGLQIKLSPQDLIAQSRATVCALFSE